MSWYFIRGRKDFNGPPVAQDEDPTLQGEMLKDSEKTLASDTEPITAKEKR